MSTPIKSKGRPFYSAVAVIILARKPTKTNSKEFSSDVESHWKNTGKAIEIDISTTGVMDAFKLI
jgi:hypothetical protein